MIMRPHLTFVHLFALTVTLTVYFLMHLIFTRLLTSLYSAQLASTLTHP